MNLIRNGHVNFKIEKKILLNKAVINLVILVLIETEIIMMSKMVKYFLTQQML